MNAAPVIAVLFGFVRVIVSTEVPLTAIAPGEKDFDAVGGDKTVSVAFAATAFEPELADKEPTEIEFAYAPAVAAVTLTVTVHVLLAGIVPPVYEILFAPATAVTVPPTQIVDPPGTAALTSPLG